MYKVLKTAVQSSLVERQTKLQSWVSCNKHYV